MESLLKAIKHFGSQAALARALGISPMAVAHWKDRGIPIPRCVDIERATGGAVKKADLRPDIFS